MPSVSIVIGTYTNHKGLAECLDSIVQYTDLSDTEIIVVANGADEIVRTFPDRYPIRLLWFDKPLGYPKANNHGIRAALGQFVILLNDDCVLLEQNRHDWINVLLTPFNDSAVGISGPQRSYDENSNHHFLIFFCVMLRRTCLDDIGLLDEITDLGFGEDTIACIEAERKGWKVVQVPVDDHVNTLAVLAPDTTLEKWQQDKVWAGDYPLFHRGEQTIGFIENCDEVLNRNRVMLRERYNPEMNTPTGGCDRCGGPMLDGVCVGAENKLNCDGLYLWRASVVDGWFSVSEMQFLAYVVKNRGKIPEHAASNSSQN